MHEKFSRRGLGLKSATALGVCSAFGAPQLARATEVLQLEPRPMYFAETGHHLSGEFQDFWRRHRNGYVQDTQRFRIKYIPSIEVPDHLRASYDLYWNAKRTNDLWKLLWPGEVEVDPLGKETATYLGIDTSSVPKIPQAVDYSATLSDAQKRIEVSISDQTLTAYEGTLPVFNTLVSTGRNLFGTPLGNHSVLAKVEVMDYKSPFPNRYNYFAPKVPFNLRVRWEGIFIHGTYWHDNFGTKTSAGCVNLNIDDAHWIYEWARVKTPVVIKK